jgi:hypothetical protein
VPSEPPFFIDREKSGKNSTESDPMLHDWKMLHAHLPEGKMYRLSQ